MSNVKFKLSNVLKAYKGADASGKKLLKDLAGDQVDFDQKITDVIKTFEDACEALNINPASLQLDVLEAMEDGKALVAFKKLSIIRQALNEGWTPDWSNSNETKYYPWMKYVPGSGFSFHVFGYGGTASVVGSRLCFKSRELAEYAGKQFRDLYNDLFVL